MSTSAILSLNEFKSSIDHFAKGTWDVEYYDRTHLDRNEMPHVLLGSIEIEEVTPKGDVIFRFKPTRRKSENEKGSEKSLEEAKYLETLIEKAWNKGKVDGKKKPEEAARIILDQLSESMVRLGLIKLEFEIDPPEFKGRRFAVMILDTNALRDGAVRHLQEQFQSVQLWVIIPTVSLMEIGERVANMTKMDKNGCKKQHSALIRLRPQVTIVPQEVKWIKENFPTETLELAPELLRTFRGYETRQNDPSKEPDRVSINDRLILESIKDLRRQRGFTEGIYLMSGDKDMSRLARLEGISTIYPALPSINEFSDGVYSIRYSLEARTYISCSIHRFLWDLAHVFSKIRFKCLSGPQTGRIVDLFYYYPTKLVNDWVDDKLEVTDFGSGTTA